jgi:hypothetical protein
VLDPCSGSYNVLEAFALDENSPWHRLTSKCTQNSGDGAGGVHGCVNEFIDGCFLVSDLCKGLPSMCQWVK